MTANTQLDRPEQNITQEENCTICAMMTNSGDTDQLGAAGHSGILNVRDQRW